MTETIEVVTDGDERVDQQALAEQLLADAKANNVELIGPGGLLNQLTKRVRRGDVRPAVESSVRPAGHGGGVPSDDVDVLAAPARRVGPADRIFDAVKAVVAQTGVLVGKTRRALDFTTLDDAVATQDTVIQLIAAIRRVRRQVSGAPEVITRQCTAHDYDDPEKPKIAWNDAAARRVLVDALVGDAHRLLGHLPEQELGPEPAAAVALLALIAGQDVEPVAGSDGTDGRWQIAQRVAPDRVIGRWGETFSDDVVAAAMIDRLVHHAEVLTLTGDSYRTRQRRELLAKQNWANRD